MPQLVPAAQQCQRDRGDRDEAGADHAQADPWPDVADAEEHPGEGSWCLAHAQCLSLYPLRSSASAIAATATKLVPTTPRLIHGQTSLTPKNIPGKDRGAWPMLNASAC